MNTNPPADWNQIPADTQALLETIATELKVHQAPAAFWQLARVPALLADHWTNLKTQLIDGGPLEPHERAAVAWATISLNPCTSAYQAIDHITADVLSEAQRLEAVAIASICTTYNTLFKFRHMAGNDDIEALRAGLRVKTFKETSFANATSELISVGVSAINACELCVAAHTRKALSLGMGPEQVDHAVKIAAVVDSMTRFLAACPDR
ncbi:carboxymuconolactone decarboxylase family protein [Mucisphaera sp.]|uniref:carboxymuconolactone decarboxylase family protein n=1 Tax=Mucisphaera sp. TaxID=2913024 RepID=UPI003D0F28D8